MNPRKFYRSGIHHFAIDHSTSTLYEASIEKEAQPVGSGCQIRIVHSEEEIRNVESFHLQEITEAEFDEVFYQGLDKMKAETLKMFTEEHVKAFNYSSEKSEP